MKLFSYDRQTFYHHHFLCISMIKVEDSIYDGNYAINVYSLTDRQTNGCKDGRMDGQKDRQTDR